MLLEIIIILGLILANGTFALAEIAVVSSRRASLRKMASRGNPRAAAALSLSESPTRFLSTVQLGITLIGVLAGAFGGATIARDLAKSIAAWPLIGSHALEVSVGVVVVCITFLSLILGELVPKRIALSRPERTAMLVARPMQRLARLGGPLISFLSDTTDIVLRWLHVGSAREATVSDEEVAMLIEQGLHEGVFHEGEKHMVEAVLALDRLSVTSIMTPRPHIVWLNVDSSDEVNWRKIVASGHSHFPVYRGAIDHVIGMVSVKALWANSSAGFMTPMKDLLTKPLFVPESVNCYQLLESFKSSGRHIALVTDEFGTTGGIVTLIDVLEAIVGNLPSRGQAHGPEAVQRADGSWLIDATLPFGDLKETLGFVSLSEDDRGDFHTLGGFLITHFGRIPATGDSFEANGFRWEVADMDHFRIDKALVTPLPPAGESDETVG